MTPITDQANISYHGNNWADALAAACSQARETIHISALSMHPPSANAIGDWSRLWRAWCDAVRRDVLVAIWLPIPSPIHPATLRNTTAGRAILAAGMQIHYVKGPRLLHAKTAVIDARSVWIGSGNYTAAAAHHNHEAYLQADCPRIARAVIARWESLA